MKDDRLYLIHVSECITRIESYTAGGKNAFFASTLIQDAVLRNVLVHDYLGVDLDRAWLIVERELSRLKQTFEAMQKELP